MIILTIETREGKARPSPMRVKPPKNPPKAITDIVIGIHKAAAVSSPPIDIAKPTEAMARVMAIISGPA